MKKKAGWIMALLFLWILNGMALFRWVKKDTRPLAWDQAIHTQVGLDYRDRLHRGTSLLDPAYFNYPPLYHLTLALAIGHTEDVADAGALVNFFYLAILIGAVFSIGDRLLGKWPAFTASVFITCYPIMADMARQTMIDLALTALVAAAVAFLLMSEDFRRPLPSISFGLILGLSMLMKWTAFLYILGPFVCIFVRGLRRKRLFWALAGGAVALAVIAPWYAVNLIPMFGRIHNLVNLPPANGVVLKGVMSWLWYPFALPELLNLPFLALLIPGLLSVLWKRQIRPVFWWFIVSLFMFSLINNRNIRYAMPALPAAALLSVAWLPSATTTLRRIPFIIMNAMAALFFVLLQFFPGHVPNVHAGSFVIPIVENKPPLAVNWQHAAIIDRILQLKPKEKFSLVLTPSDTAEFHSTTLNISAAIRGQKDFSFVGPPSHRWLEFADFILLKTGDVGPGFTTGTIDECVHFLEHPPAWFFTIYKEVGRWPLPDGSTAVLYHNDPSLNRRIDEGILDISLDEFRIPNVVAKRMSLRAVPSSPSDTANGKLKDLTLNCATFDYKGLVVRDVRIRLHKPQIILPLFLESQEIELLSLDTFSPDATVDAETLVRYAREKLPWLADPAVRFEGSEIVVSGRVRGQPVLIRAALLVRDGHLETHLDKISIAGISLPRLFLRAVTDRVVPLAPNREVPFRLNIRAIQGDGEKLRIVSGA